MYVFDVSARLGTVERVLGMKYVYWKDVANRVVFVRDGRIVYHEDEFYSEHVPSGHVGFELPANTEYMDFSPSARFIGRVEKIDNRRYYVLAPEQKN